MEKQNFQLTGRNNNKGLNYCGAFFIAVILFIVGNTISYSSEADQLEGAAYFKQMCAACHTINGGILVGPDLANVHERRSDAWLQKFIKSSQTFINSGDPDAVAIFQQFNKTVMPDPPFTDDQIAAIILYIKAASGGDTQAPEQEAAASVDTDKEGTEQDIVIGQNLFQGKIRLANGGPACISCHDVKNDAVIGGGILARELTTVFSRLGGPGVRAILGSAPFPVMQQAYLNKPLTDEEIFSLVSFLRQADRDHMLQQPRDYGVGLAVTGLIGVIVLLGIYSLLWYSRRKNPVNQDIFDRQVKSQ